MVPTYLADFQANTILIGKDLEFGSYFHLGRYFYLQ